MVRIHSARAAGPLLVLAFVLAPYVTHAAGPDLSARIDALIEASWDGKEITPAGPSSDAEFFRRITLDLTGTIPRDSDLAAFLGDSSPDRRERAIDRLLESEAFSRHFATVVYNWLIPRKPENRINQGDEFREWLRSRIQEKDSWARIVRSVLTADGPIEEKPAGVFFLANGPRPETLASESSRIFLGMRIGCAQCHDHPFAELEQKDFWRFAAFYSQVRRERGKEKNTFILTDKPRNSRNGKSGNRNVKLVTAPRIRIPDSKETVDGRFLDGTEPALEENAPFRRTLASWITSTDNPYFARAAVNRFWAHFFNRGLVNPVDGFVDDPDGSHPELLKLLASEFRRSEFDLRKLIGAIVKTGAYQRSTRVKAEAPEEAFRVFAARQIRALSPEQLFDSFVRATGAEAVPSRGEKPSEKDIERARASRLRTIELLASAENPDSPQTYEGSIAVTLFLINGPLTNNRRTPWLEALARDEKDSKKVLEALFLRTLSRRPDAEESETLLDFLNGAGDRGEAIRNVFWSLLNTSEFAFNH